MQETYFEILLKLSEKAALKKEVPVSALVVKNSKIIAKAYNKRQSKKSVLNHAEIIAIIKANKKLNDWRLNNCDLYVTLKPCNMCETIIKQSRIRNVYYILDKLPNKNEYSKTNFIKANIRTLEDEYSSQLSAFFHNQRDK